MKKVLLLAIAALTALSMVPASAAFSVSGTVIGANPATKNFFVGLTEAGNPCGQPDPDLGSTQGVDGFWFEIPEGHDGAAATLTSNAVDADVWFYDEACGFLSYSAMATQTTANESGAIPAGAFFGIVNVAVGANTSFTFSAA